MLSKNRNLFIQKQLEKYNIVSTTDTTGDIVEVNSKFCEIAQYSQEELIGKNHRILNSGIHPNSLFIDLWETITKGKTWNGEICNRAKDGSLYWAETFIIPEMDDNNNPIYYHAFRVLITKQKKLEQELLKAKQELKKQVEQLKIINQRYQNLYNTTPEMYFTLDEKGIMVEVNSFGAVSLGYVVNELKGKPVLMLFDKHLHKVVKKQLKKILDNPTKIHQWEIQKNKKSGELITVSETAWIENESAKSSSIRIICKDITKRKNAENALIAERNLLINGPTVVFQWEEGQGLPYTYISPNVDTVFGYTADDFLTKKAIYNKIIHPDDQLRIIEEVILFKKYASNTYEQEYRIIHKDGSIKWVRVHVQMTRNSDGKIMFYNAHLYDVTEQHLAQEETILVKERLLTLIEAIPDAIFFKDGKGRWLITNKAALNLFDLNKTAWLGKTDKELAQIRPEHAHIHKEFLQSDEEAWRAKKLTSSTTFTVNGLSEKRELSVKKIPLFNKDGSRKALIIVSTDITESKKKETEIITKNAKLEQVAWMFSHEVRAPVATIMGLANIFNFEDNTDPINTDVLTRISDPLNSLYDVVSYIVKETNELEIDIPSTSNRKRTLNK